MARIDLIAEIGAARTAGDDDLRPGDPAWLGFTRCHVFDKASGTRLRSYPEAGESVGVSAAPAPAGS